MQLQLPAPFLHTGAGIYAIINSLNGKIYVGSAVRCNHRWNCHRSELEQSEHGNRYLLRAFKKTPEALELQLIEELHNPSKETLLQREQFWIDFYQSFIPEKGYNIAPKARSCQGIKRDPEYVARVSKSLTGFKHSEQAKANMKAAQARIKRGPRSEATKLRMKWARLGTRLSDKARKNWRTAHDKYRWSDKAILQFSETGEFIREFRCIADAEREFGKRSNIHSVCKGKRRLAFGCIWKYKSNLASRHSVALTPRKEKAGRRIHQLDSTHAILKTFNSAAQAARSVRDYNGNILKACQRNWKTKGFYWRFEDAS